MTADLADGPEPRVGCGAVILRGGEILLLRRIRPPEAGCWGIPGGKVDPYETLPDAVRREVEEETGLRLGGLELLCVVDQIDRDEGAHWVAPAYVALTFEGEARNCEPEKHSGLGWFGLDALPQPLTTPTRVALEALRSRRPD
jgi:ADP-ribose pyrophosphatase YjhB (NUDIX family)